MVIDPNLISVVVAIVAFLYVVLFGQEPIAKVIRSWKEQRRKPTENSVTYLPDYKEHARIIEPIKERIGAADYKGALTNIAKAYLGMGDEEKARLAAGTGWDTLRLHRQEIRFANDDLEIAKGDPYLTALLLVLHGENLVYLGRKDAVLPLRDAIRLMENVAPEDSQQTRRREHILGRAYNNVAYFYWSVGNYEHSAREYLLALPHLRRAGNPLAYADTRKNLAYIYALQGNLTPAEILCKDALGSFQSLGNHAGEALSLNTLGLINVEGQQHETARMRCEKALGIFESLGMERGVGLACTALGNSLRRLASRDAYAPRETNTFFRDAEHSLNRAVNIFTNTVSEPLRLVHAHNELGCTYRDWAAFYRRQGDSECAKLEASALDNLQASQDLAKRIGVLVERADTLEDMAQVYFNRCEYARALQLLDESESLIPQEYLIKDSTGAPTVVEPVAPFWSVLGKTSLLRGHIAFDQAQKKDAARWYTLASAYFGLYAKATALTDYAVRSVYTRVCGLPSDELVDWRRFAGLCEKEYHLGRTKLTEVLDDTLGQI